MNSQEFYNQLLSENDHYGAKKYLHGWPGNFHRSRIKILKEIFANVLNCRKETEILDIGSGLSMFSEIFSKEDCPKITAFDVSDVVIEKAKKASPHINFLVDDAQNPKIQGCFDAVFSGEIIEHLPDPGEAISNWSKLVKKGGYLVVSTPNKLFNRKNKEHISLLAVWEMKKLLRELNFKIIKIIGIDIFNPFVDSVLSMVSRRFPKFSDKIFQIKMGLTKKIPWLANNIIYVYRKQ